MFLITRRKQFGPTTFLWDVQAPDVARAVRPGHFIMARLDEHGERIPLTVADFNAGQGTVTVVIQAVGKTTIEMMALREGDFILDFVGPLGLPSHIRELDGTVVLAALCSDGVVTIRNIRQIDRGYQRVEEKLRSLGAHIERVPITA